MSERVYIGLGSNLEQPALQIARAVNFIERIPETRLIGQSRLYASKPQGPQDQPDFVNAVCLVETELDPMALLEALQTIEKDQGRVKKRHWGERLIDLDILLFGERRIHSEVLTVPHKELAQRDFVLLPLAEMAPDLNVPGLGSIGNLIADLEQRFVVPVEQA